MGDPGFESVAKENEAPVGKLRRRVRMALVRLSWVYLLAVLLLWALVRFAGDRWWLATLVLFGPLWGAAVPLTILGPAAIAFCRRALYPLVIAGAVLGFGVLDVCLPWRALVHGRASGPPIRMLTCNVHNALLNTAEMNRLLEQSKPDIVILQEAWKFQWKPSAGDETWNFRRHGELFIAARYPILQTVDYTDRAWRPWGGAGARYDIAAPGGTLHLFSLHLASPHMPFRAVRLRKAGSVKWLQEHLAMRGAQSDQFSSLAKEMGNDVILGGDFNTPCQSALYHREWSGFSDAFNAAGLGTGHSYFGLGASVRIDHLLSAAGWRCIRCRVGPDVGSPHRPVIADFERTGSE